MLMLCPGQIKEFTEGMNQGLRRFQGTVLICGKLFCRGKRTDALFQTSRLKRIQPVAELV